MIYGWLMVACPRALVDPGSGVILPLSVPSLSGLGSIDRISSFESMIWVTTALMAMISAYIAFSGRHERLIFAGGVSASGLVVAGIGLWMRVSGDAMEFWGKARLQSNAFGLFWYHGNAGAFLNLTWPISAWLAICLLRKPGMQTRKAICVVSAFVQIVAVFVNVSKGGQALAIVEALAFVGCLFALVKRSTSGRSSANRILAVVIGVGLVAAIAWLAGSAEGWKRWESFANRQHWHDKGRDDARSLAWQAGRDGGITGFGPGTFQWVFAHYSQGHPNLEKNRWVHAHNDYAETLVDWGWLGAAVIGLGVAGIGCASASALWACLLGANKKTLSFDHRSGICAGFIVLVTVCLHAWFDFPFQIPPLLILTATIAGWTLAMTNDKYHLRKVPRSNGATAVSSCSVSHQGPQYG